MTSKEIGDSLVGVASKVKLKAESANALLKQKAQTSLLVEDITSKFETHISVAISKCESGDLSDKQSFELLLKAAKDFIQIMRASSKKLAEEVIHIKGYIDGVSSTAAFIEETGNAAIRESERVKALAESDIDINANRKLGERPESLRVKRAASEKRLNEKGDKQAID
jgi:hypothetical protein